TPRYGRHEKNHSFPPNTIRRAVSKPTEWQRIGHQIGAVAPGISLEAAEVAALDYCASITALESSNTRIIAWREDDQERYFAYATALRTASGPAYQIGPCRSRSLIRSKPSSFLRGRIS